MIQKIKFWVQGDRIGPDMPLMHWMLHFKKTMRFLCVKKFKYFGENAAVRPFVYAVACSKISIGKNTTIRPLSCLFADPRPNGGGITIEDDVLLGGGIHFYTNNHMFNDISKPIYEQDHKEATISNSIRVSTGCWIGASSIILPGVEIGQNAVIGAGTVVTKSVPAFCVFAGNPGKVIRFLR